MKYRKKPVVIDAVQWTGANLNEILEFVPVGKWRIDGHDLFIITLEGEHFATPNDFIIREVKGEFYPCKPDIFEMTYELVK